VGSCLCSAVAALLDTRPIFKAMDVTKGFVISWSTFASDWPSFSRSSSAWLDGAGAWDGESHSCPSQVSHDNQGLFINDVIILGGVCWGITLLSVASKSCVTLSFFLGGYQIDDIGEGCWSVGWGITLLSVSSKS